MSTASTFSISKKSFGNTKKGKSVSLFTLTNPNGMSVSITNYGGIITELWVPDRNGNLGNIVIGLPDIGHYEDDVFYLGALVGRYANRIEDGRFSIDNQDFTLEVNNGPNHLHGASYGFNKCIWAAETHQEDDSACVTLKHTSPDGEGGYPGNLEIVAEYKLTADNKLLLTMWASSDKKTPVSLTQHSYFNLSGSDSVLDHELKLNAKQMTPVNENIIPTGERSCVAGGPFDFNEFTAVGKNIDQDNAQLALAGGYDHNFVIEQAENGSFEVNGILRDPRSGRVMTLSTNMPGMQLYSVNLDGAVLDANGNAVMQPRGAICLEPQHFPNACNQSDFPSPWILAGETKTFRFEYKFSTY